MYFENFLPPCWGFWFACITTAALILLSVYFLNGFFKGRSTPSVRQDAGYAATQEEERDRSISAPPGFDYEVFLSFRGPDTRKGFTDFLYQSLIGAGVAAFLDDEELRVGEEIGPDLLQAISNSKISIPIFSEGYASSKWCLKEVAQMVKCRDQKKQVIFPIFYDVTPHDVRHQTGPFAEAFSQHRKRYDPKTVQEWRHALNEIGALKGWERENVADGHEGLLVKIVVSTVLTELKNAYLVTTDCLVGVDHHVEEVIKLLEDGGSDVSIVGICGIGGIGKTTIAQVVYNQLLKRFDYHCFLKDIRETSLQKGLEYLQRELISKILNINCPEFRSSDEGIRMMQQRLHDKRVLILLDDVDQKSQLNALAGNHGCFAPGSFIIVTTRNKETLNLPLVGSRSRSSTYEVSAMLQDQALLLFCKHAFQKDVPTADLSNLSKDIVKTTGGLPLAVEVIGSFLRGKSEEVWKSTLEQLKQMPNDDVQKKLKISYDALNHVQKQIFLDIACHLIGTDKRIAVHMWKDCDFYPEVGIEVLSLMSLVKVVDDVLWMHDQLRDLGREIVRGENYNEPEKRSRLWRTEEATDVLQRLKEQGQGVYCDEQGTLPIETLCLNPGTGLENCCLTNGQFKRLSKLRFLYLNKANLAGSFQPPLSKLRWLCWHSCPLEFLLTDLDLKNMVILDLSSSKITDDWDNWSAMQMAVKLKVLNLRNCRNLTRTPVFSAFSTLERLILEGCTDLVVIEPLIRQLKSLVYLNVKYCSSLEKLPPELGSMGALSELLVDGTRLKEIPISKGMNNLKILSAEDCTKIEELPDSIGCLMKLACLSLSHCSSLTKLPDSIGQLTSLVEMNLSYTKIGALPDSIGGLCNLEVLKVDNSLIKNIPGTIGMLQKLKVINASRCNCLTGEIPHEIRMLSFLRTLRLDGTSISLLPGSISELSHLQTLDLTECKKLQSVAKLPSSLAYLHITCESKLSFPHLSDLINLKELSIVKCVNLEKISEDIGKLTKLEKLRVCGLEIITLPEEIGALSRLKELVIEGCVELRYLPKLPSSLYNVRIDNCCLFTKLPNLSNLNSLSALSLVGCSELTEIQSFGDLVSLTSLKVGECPKLAKLGGLGDLVSLKGLRISLCPELTELDGLQKLASLKSLEVFDWSLERLPDLSMLMELTDLTVTHCKNLVALPDLSNLKKLRSLKLIDYDYDDRFKRELRGCPSLREIKGLDGLDSLVDLNMAKCTSIETLPGLSNLKNLGFLDLNGCQSLRAIEGLDGLDGLEFLYMGGCTSIETLSDLSRLKKLERLSLNDCGSLRAIEGLDGLDGLKSLYMDGCTSIEALSDLSRLKKLERLSLNDCESLRAIEGLDGLDGLECLYMHGCTSIETLYDLSRLKKLERLSLNDCRSLRAIEGLDGLDGLESLYMDGCTSIEALSDLSRLKKLERLSLNDCGSLRAIEGLDGLDGLEFLYMDGCTSIETLSDLSRLKKLERLSLNDCGSLRTIEGLDGLDGLKSLYMDGCTSIEALSDLSRLNKLERLSLNDCGSLRAIEGLDGLDGLTELDIAGCTSIETLPDLSNLKKLRSLNLERCQSLRAIEGLDGLDVLEHLMMAGCTSIETLFDLSRLKKLNELSLDICQSLRAIEGLDGLVYLTMAGYTSIEALSDLQRLKKLEWLSLENCRSLRAIEGLDGLDGLKYLILDGCTSIEALSNLSRLKKLISLTLDGCDSLHKIEGLEELESLTQLNIFECRAIEKLPNLSKLQNLQQLSISGCDKVTGIQGLEELKSLEFLDIDGCTALENVPDLPNVKTRR